MSEVDDESLWLVGGVVSGDRELAFMQGSVLACRALAWRLFKVAGDGISPMLVGELAREHCEYADNLQRPLEALLPIAAIEAFARGCK